LIDSYIYVRNIEPSEHRHITEQHDAMFTCGTFVLHTTVAC